MYYYSIYIINLIYLFKFRVDDDDDGTSSLFWRVALVDSIVGSQDENGKRARLLLGVHGPAPSKESHPNVPIIIVTNNHPFVIKAADPNYRPGCKKGRQQ